MSAVAALGAARSVPVGSVHPYGGNPRRIPLSAVQRVAASIEAFGWQQPIVVDSGMVIILGHTRLAAAKHLGLAEVPVITETRLSADQVRALRIADNRTHDYTTWDYDAVAAELAALGDADLGDVIGVDDWAELAAHGGPEPLPDGWGDEWYTPGWIFDAAGIEFDLDVCAPAEPHLRTCPARSYLTIADDGLAQSWRGVVWMNPPYSRPAPWVSRWAQHDDGMALLQTAPTARWLAELLPATDEIALLQVQDFGRPDGSAEGLPAALMLVARGSCRGAVARVAAADPHTGGAWFTRPPRRARRGT